MRIPEALEMKDPTPWWRGVYPTLTQRLGGWGLNFESSDGMVVYDVELTSWIEQALDEELRP